VRLGLRSLLIGIAILVLGLGAYSRRFQISAMVWHWKNGDFVPVGSYKLPVPEQWLVKTQPLGGSLLVDTRNQRGMSLLSGINVISADYLSAPAPDLDLWTSTKRKWLKDNGIGDPETRSLNFENEAVACLGGHELQEVMRLPDATDVVSVDCRSSGRLHLTFIGRKSDLQIFYSIIPRIRKQK